MTQEPDRKRPGNVIRQGEVYEVCLYYFSPEHRADGSLWFPVRVKAFGSWIDGEQNVIVEAVEKSDYAENEWTVPFRALRRVA